MSAIIRMAEQHITLAESRLRHIDEMVARADVARRQTPIASDLELQLAEIQQTRDLLARQIGDLRKNFPNEAAQLVERSEGLKKVLDKVGLQLEQALAAIF